MDIDGGVSDLGLALARLFDFDVLLPEDLGAAHFLNADGFRHGAILSRRSLPSKVRRGHRLPIRICRAASIAPPQVSALVGWLKQ